MKKNINKPPIKKDSRLFMLSIYQLLKEGKSPSEIALFLNITQPAVSYHLRRLRASGSVRKLGYGVWEALKLNTKEHKQIKVGGCLPLREKSLCSFGNVRGHGFKFRVRIPKLNNWGRRIEFLNKSKIKYDIINKGHTQRIIFKGCKVWLNSGSIVVYFPKGLSFFGGSAKITEGGAFFEISEIMRKLDTLFNCSFKINKNYQIKIFGKHQADIGNGLAKMYCHDRRSINVHNSDGLWLLIDDSFNINELETVGATGKNDATKDLDNIIKPFFNGLKEMPFVPSDFHRLAHSVVKVADSVNVISKQHLETVEGLKSVVGILNILVKKPKVNKNAHPSMDISEVDYVG